MRRTSFAHDECPIAASADAVGDVWNLLILRDVFDGYTRFDELQTELGIAPNTLTRRLATLIDAGLLQRRQYQPNPPRDEYVLTDRGHDFHPVVLALFAIGNTGLRKRDKRMLLVDRETGTEVDPVLVDRKTSKPISNLSVMFAPGPAASSRMRDRLADVARRAVGART
jgi:DNA-binding HxlR family transcriptional regulator